MFDSLQQAARSATMVRGDVSIVAEQRPCNQAWKLLYAEQRRSIPGGAFRRWNGLITNLKECGNPFEWWNEPSGEEQQGWPDSCDTEGEGFRPLHAHTSSRSKSTRRTISCNPRSSIRCTACCGLTHTRCRRVISGQSSAVS